MQSIKWLHFSDLHVYINDPSMMDFKEYLSDYTNMGNMPDFIVITGDYRNIQSKEHFDKAKQFIHFMMNLFKLDLSKDLFIVPGNHDMCLQKKKIVTSGCFLLRKYSEADNDPRTHELRKLLPAGLEPWDRSSYNTNWLKKHAKDPVNYIDRLCGVKRHTAEDENIVNLQTLTDGFAEYCDMAKSIVSWYGGNGISPAAAHLRKWENDSGMGLNLVHINTALAADGSYNHYQAIDLISVKNILNNIRNGLPTLILAHNSFYDLHPGIRRQLTVPLSHANTYAWLCGDSHRFATKKVISRPKNDGRNPIQILTCGKSAPDHSDNYSDNGFFEYIYDGKNINVQLYKWSHNQIQKKENIQISIKTSGAVEKTEEKSKHLMIGYLSCNPTVEFQKKYHLGHAYFIHTIDQLLKDNNYALIMTSLSLRTNNRTRKTYEEDQKYGNEMIKMWKNCFNGKVEVLDIKNYYEKTNPLEEPALALLNYVNTMERVMETDSKCNDIVDHWFHNEEEDIKTSDYDYIKNLFMKDLFIAPQGDSVIQTELLSFAYLLHKRPIWYTSDWLIRFIEFWNKNIYYLIQNKLQIPVCSNNFCIVESKRNHYVWDAVSYCAKRFGYINFPRVQYFDTLLNTDCKQPMRSSDMEKAVFLADSGRRTNYSDEFTAHVRKLFDTDLKPEDVAEEYYSRLFKS